MNKKELFQKLYTVLVLVVIIAIISLVAPKASDKQNTSAFSVTGFLSCLEPSLGYSSGCVPGIISDEGARYILDASNATVKDETIAQETRVLVKGVFTPLADNATTASFGAVGIVVVSTIDRAN